jgi:hypothetical protein
MFHQSASMKGFVMIAALGAAIAASGCGGDKTAGGTTGAPGPSAAPTAVISPTMMPSSSASSPTVTPPAASATGEPADDDAPVAGAKTFDCGAKGQKPCPMQKWMKTVMAGASSSGDGARLAEALTYVANHAPPGFATWSALATDGAKKAKADDIDGAKVSCKQCHEQYKKKYKSTLRDRPF